MYRSNRFFLATSTRKKKQIHFYNTSKNCIQIISCDGTIGKLYVSTHEHQ